MPTEEDLKPQIKTLWEALIKFLQKYFTPPVGTDQETQNALAVKEHAIYLQFSALSTFLKKQEEKTELEKNKLLQEKNEKTEIEEIDRELEKYLQLCQEIKKQSDLIDNFTFLT